MQKLTKSIVFFSTAIILTITGLTTVSADGGCTPIYGGGVDCPSQGGCTPVYGGGVSCPRPGQILIDKKVQNPATGGFVDNLGALDPKYRPLNIVTFQIVVKNPGDETLPTITVTDSIPQFVDYTSGPGTYDPSARKLTFTVDNLGGGQTRTFEIKARISHPAQLPEGKNIICPTNVINAKVNDKTDHDESQFCIEKKMEVPTVPTAGPENWLLSITGITTFLGIGLKLRKAKIG